VFASLNGNALQTPTYNGEGNERKIDSFFWKLEAHFGAVGIMDEGQKVSHASFSLKDIALVWWRRRCDNINRGSNPITTWEDSRRNSRNISIPRMRSGKQGAN